ncbi:MAG: hypothetical protein ACYDHH_04690 [Solirubrobacteraceae bacterium]
MTALIAALALPGAALAGGFTAQLSAPTHTPKVGSEPITVTATRGKQKLSGTVNYHFLFNGQVVSSQPGHSFSNGVFHDKLLWPNAAIGHRITLQVIVQTKYGTDYIDYWIQVRQ